MYATKERNLFFFFLPLVPWVLHHTLAQIMLKEGLLLLLVWTGGNPVAGSNHSNSSQATGLPRMVACKYNQEKTCTDYRIPHPLDHVVLMPMLLTLIPIIAIQT